MGAEGKQYITQKRTEDNRKIYGDKYWQLVTVGMKKKRTRSLPRNPSWRKEAGMETLLDLLIMMR